jgi:hypothetical protein
MAQGLLVAGVADDAQGHVCVWVLLLLCCLLGWVADEAPALLLARESLAEICWLLAVMLLGSLNC